jgi:hypothetical protein
MVADASDTASSMGPPVAGQAWLAPSASPAAILAPRCILVLLRVYLAPAAGFA